MNPQPANNQAAQACFEISSDSGIRSPLAISAGIHAAIMIPLVFLWWTEYWIEEERPVKFSVIEKPKAAPIRKEISTPKVPMSKPPKKSEPRKVFGVTKKALVSNNESGDSSVKIGNTVATEVDEKILNENDAESLPIPAEEYLVTEMPTLLSEVRAVYPEPARREKIEGPVILDLLIDAEGFVRDVELIEGQGFGLDEAAIEAVYQFEFSPARIDKQNVAVRVRYTYRFILE